MDMWAVNEIDPCALLYVVAQVDRIARSLHWRVRGNLPASPGALKVLHDARFDDVFHTTRTKKKVPGPASLQISFKPVGRRLNPEDWLPLHDFLKENGRLTEEETEEVYNAFGECVENVRQHAYPNTRAGSWYALAIKPFANKPARAVVIDLGAGIARTIRRTRTDIILQWMRSIMSSTIRAALLVFGEDTDDNFLAQAVDRLGRDDYTCLFFATQGLRTRSSEKQRGTGLNGLREAVSRMGRGALHVLSGESSVTWPGGMGPLQGRLPFLHGTAVCLEFGGSYDAPSVPGGSRDES